MGGRGKYERWLEPDGLILIQGWTREGLSDEQDHPACAGNT